jgi:hypothetical protein
MGNLNLKYEGNRPLGKHSGVCVCVCVCVCVFVCEKTVLQ